MPRLTQRAHGLTDNEAHDLLAAALILHTSPVAPAQ